jgi:predicted HTH transcriptional regulator
MVELTDADLLGKLRNFEDTFVARKTVGDSKDWLKTIVAFANSTPAGYPSVLFIGAKDDGTIEAGRTTSILPKNAEQEDGGRLPANLLPPENSDR